MPRGYYPNRTLCDVFSEMRDCWKTRNFAGMRGLIEEAQHIANRMESALYDIKDHENIGEDLHQMRQEYKELRRKIKAAKKELGEDE